MATQTDNSLQIPGPSQMTDMPSKPVSPPSHPKKKKKKKNSASPNSSQNLASAARDSVEQSRPLPNEESIKGNGVNEWRARAFNRRALLDEAKAENTLLSTDLAAALARVNDAELAEEAVNKGLVKARAVIAQRDVAIGELNASMNALKADKMQLEEDKKRLEKRLVILKTMSATLHEARESRDVAEKKLEDANRQNTSLRNEVKLLTEQIEILTMLKQKLSRAETELFELQQANDALQVKAKRDSVRAVGIGALGAVALNFAFGLLSGGRKK